MTEHAPPRNKISLALWIGGALLWGVVGWLLYANYLQSQGNGVVEDGKVAVNVRTSRGDEAGGAGGMVEAQPVWDPNGIGDFSLTERSGETVTKQDLLGKPWIIGFIFTRCAGPCPQVSGQMSLLQRHFQGEPIRLVTLTVDPDYDSPEVLSHYAKAFGAEENWLFLTGEKAKIYTYVEEHLKMPVEEMQGEDRKPGWEVLHTTNLLLIDAQGVVRGKYNALVPEEIAKLKKDAAELIPAES